MRRNPLGSAPSTIPEGALNRAGSKTSEDVARWAGATGAEELYEGVHVSTSVSAAAAYALGRLKVEEYPPEVLDAPVLIGYKAIHAEDKGDMDVLTTAMGIWQESSGLAESAAEEEVEPEDLEEWAEENPDLLDEVAMEVSASSYVDDVDYMGFAAACGDLANRPEREDAIGALLTMTALRLERGEFEAPRGVRYRDATPADRKLRKEAIALAKNIVPQERFLTALPWSKVVFVGVLPPIAPGQNVRPTRDGGGYQEGFPYETDPAEMIRDDYDLTRDTLDAVVWDHLRPLVGDPNDVVYWHGTGSVYATQAYPELNLHALNELSFDSSEYLSDGEEEDDEDEDW